MSIERGHKSLTQMGYILKKKHLKREDHQFIERDLTFEPIAIKTFAKFTPNRKFFTYIETTHRYYLPRFWALEHFGPPEHDLLTNTGQTKDWKFYWDLLPHQEKSWEALMKQFCQPDSPKGGILSVPCGFGKTILAIRMAWYLKKKAIIVVNKEFLMFQWINAIQKCSNAKIGIIQQSKVDVEDKDIIIAMLHSLSLKDYPPEIFEDIGYCAIDEVHHIGSESFSKALPKIACEYTLGLSATPLRKDGLTQVFLNYLGPIFHQEKRDGSNRVWIKGIEISSTSENYREMTLESTGTKDTTKMINNISNDEATNHLIIEICRILVQEKPRKILVLGQRREQLEWLQQAWEEFSYKNFHGKYATCGLYYGNQKMNKKQYWKMLEESAKCDIIWGTNHIAKEGLDIPDLNTLLMLNGGQDVEQAVGRILRKFHKDVPPTVIDVIYKAGNFPKHFNERRHFYEETNYLIQKMKLSLTENIESAYTCKPLLKKYFAEYPDHGDPSLLKPNPRRKKKEIPIANHPNAPPVYAVTEDPTIAPKRSTISSSNKKQSTSLLVEKYQPNQDDDDSHTSVQEDEDLNLLTESEDEALQPEPHQTQLPHSQPDPRPESPKHTKLHFKSETKKPKKALPIVEFKPTPKKNLPIVEFKPTPKKTLPTITSFSKSSAIPSTHSKTTTSFSISAKPSLETNSPIQSKKKSTRGFNIPSI